MTHGNPMQEKPTDAPARRFREIHYHRFPLGTRSNIHGTCLLRSHLPVRLPRPHTMQLIYDHPPPGVGYRRAAMPQWQEARDQASFTRQLLEHERSVIREIKEERVRAAAWLDSKKALARTHVVIATQTGLQFFIAGFGYWNIMDIDLHLSNEACVGVKAFEVWTEGGAHEREDSTLADGEHSQAGVGEDDPAGLQSPPLPTLVVALTTYVKGSFSANDPKEPAIDEAGVYRLYALGADSLPPIPQDFIDKHALKHEEVAESSASEHSISPNLRAQPDADTTEQHADGEAANGQRGHPSSFTAPPSSAASVGSNPETSATPGEPMFTRMNAAEALPINSYAYLEERLFALRVNESTLRLDLDYLPFRISQDIIAGLPPILLVAGNDNRVHRYALGRDQIVEIEPLMCPKSDSMTFTAFDGRVIGPYHVQVMAQQEFVVSLQASRALTPDEAKEEEAKKGGDAVGRAPLMRRLLVADEEVYDSAPVLTTVFTPETNRIDRTAYDFRITQLASSSAERGSGGLQAGDVYDAEWPVGTMGDFPSRWQSPGDGGRDTDEVPPRVHVLVGFVGEDAIVYHDVPVAGLDPVPTLMGSAAGKLPEAASHIAGRLGGLGGVFSLPGSSREGLITSVHFDDLDFSGRKEIIVGTVSGAVLIYKELPAGGYALVWKRRFPAPAYGMFSVDINCDGANELVVVTLLGVHVMQPNLSIVRAKLLKQLVRARKAEEESRRASKGKDVEQ
ncbi:hypothetical protein GQ54DRAFT_295779 [Martensiomyces pterosporus]|nr:hypothetical protein GQ54DRAFT_295779 [Martensiomyces pterosporus]